MAARFEVSQVIDRPLSAVFHFVADEHVRNHPRWDPDIELERTDEGPMQVGTILRRFNSRSGTRVEGTMEVVEFERDKAFAMLIHDGPAEMFGRMTFEALGDNRTRIATVIDIPGMPESMDRSFLNSRLERSERIRKQLIEAET
ncbi:MAG: SRPBCC family protein [Anaerolineae bacterium]|nr:SRPBCC family protein [Anaerolineae bacterium]